MEEKQDYFEELVIGYLSGIITDSEKDELFSLIHQSDIFKTKFEILAKTHAASYISLFEYEKERNFNHLANILGISARTNYRKWIILFSKVAAVLLFIISISISVMYLHNDYTGSKSDNQYLFETVVPLGSLINIHLPDNTVVWLNSGSVLKYSNTFGKKSRTVFLEGEGYFEVSHNSKKKFSVYTSNIEICDIGTEFNVRSYPSDTVVEINLIKGNVKVKKIYSNKEQPIQMKSNEKLIYIKESGQMNLYTCEAYKSAQWRTGKLYLVNSTFVDVVKDIERKYDVKIKIESKKILHEYFSGSIDLNLPLNEIFEYIDVDKKYQFIQNDNIYTIKDK